MSEEEKEVELVEESVETETVETEETPEVEAEQKAETKKPTKYQKRIDELTHRQREAERQRDEYYNVAKKVMDENNKLRQQSKSFSSISAFFICSFNLFTPGKRDNTLSIPPIFFICLICIR